MLIASSKRLLRIAKYQFKLALAVNIAIALALCLITPLIFSAHNLDSFGSAFVMERFVSLIGIIYLTPLLMPEQGKSIDELVQTKRTSHILTISLRLFLSLLLIALCIYLMEMAMKLLHCDFEIGKLLIGTFATAFFLGSIGFAFSAITNNAVVGYLAAFAYYLLNFSLGSRLKHIFLFSLASNSMNEKYWLLGLGAIILIVSLRWKSVVSKTSLYK